MTNNNSYAINQTKNQEPVHRVSFQKPLMTVPSALTIISITVTFMFHSFFCLLVCLFVGFYGISTFVGYLTPNPFLCK